MRVLVTGGAGYLGTKLSGVLLDAGHVVRVLDNLTHGPDPVVHLLGRNGYHFIKGDVRDAATVASALADVDAVVHLAAIVGDPACAKAPGLARELNLHASVALFAAARTAGVGRFVFASTCSNYGKMVSTAELATEGHELRPVSLYAETKVAVEKELLGAAAGGISPTVLRFATLYGLSPRMRFDLTVNEFTMELALGNKLTVFGEQFWRPYVHVRDAARAIFAVLTAPTEKVAGKVFNVGDTDENYRKLDLVELTRARIPSAQVDFVHKSEDPRDYKVSFARIAKELDFSITRRVPDGIREIATAIEAGFFADAHAARYRNA